MNFPGIETVYRGVTFRSRNEARWASFFDELGWAWEYEALEADRYLPDFAIVGPRPLVVEVKPGFTVAELRDHAAKIERGLLDWCPYDVLVIGSTPFPGAPVEREREHPPCGLLGEVTTGPGPRSEYWWDVGRWCRCSECDRGAVVHPAGDAATRPCGHHAGGSWHEGVDRDDLLAHWRRAAERVRWEPVEATP